MYEPHHENAIKEIQSLRDAKAKRLNKEIHTLTSGGVDATEYGPAIFDNLANLRWAVNAYDYSLRGWTPDAKGFDALAQFNALRNFVRAYLVEQAAGGSIGTRNNPRSYWRTLGEISRILDRAADRMEHAAKKATT